MEFQIGITGLGGMGAEIAANFASAGRAMLNGASLEPGRKSVGAACFEQYLQMRNSQQSLSEANQWGR